MINKQVIELQEESLLQVFKISHFDKSINLSVSRNETVIMSSGTLENRIAFEDVCKLHKMRKDLIGKPVEIILFRNTAIKNILWGVGGVVVKDSLTIGVNGNYNIKIKNWKIFMNYFGKSVQVENFRIAMLNSISDLLKNNISEYVNDLKDIEDIEKEKSIYEKNVLKDLSVSELITRKMGIEIEDFRVESFIVK